MKPRSQARSASFPAAENANASRGRGGAGRAGRGPGALALWVPQPRGRHRDPVGLSAPSSAPMWRLLLKPNPLAHSTRARVSRTWRWRIRKEPELGPRLTACPLDRKDARRKGGWAARGGEPPWDPTSRSNGGGRAVPGTSSPVCGIGAIIFAPCAWTLSAAMASFHCESLRLH